MTSRHQRLPECGILPDEDFDSGDEWREAMLARQGRLLKETARILGEHDKASHVATHLNRLYAPFNIFDNLGEPAAHLVAVPVRHLKMYASETALDLQFHDHTIDLERPMAHRTLERHDGFWWFDDEDVPSDYNADDLHLDAAAECLGLVWWGNAELIDRTEVGEELEALLEE